MNLLEPLTELVDDSDVTLYECRSCGTTLSADTEECRQCGSTEIAHYEW
ncbi:hypothetical protein RBH26_08755 [Natronolimnohabitans sp. A-GB9]|nr:hypothetical protein [Natronolimnohabitans sp. A-GB9]MDQ2050576.1 hypothetical protein [Natronolimnohabitans sp. A-GB9]